MDNALIGIDVGGTYTDGVLFSDGAVVHSFKHPTDQDNLKDTLLCVLDELLAQGRGSKIQRIVLSTTLVTNLLATGRGERTALILMPGSGLPLTSYQICPDTYFLKGGIDFRGRPIENMDRLQVEEALRAIHALGIERVAVAGKFSNRNDIHERTVKELAKKLYPHMDVCTSNEISGRLNFPRRAVTCYYTAMTIREWNRFADDMEAAIQSRAPRSDLHILKADGGTSTIEASRKRPCETVFSGPAASTLGTLALSREALNAVSIDIGGTTSDISLIIGGMPLYASRGAMIASHLTHINSFAVQSIALGGDSAIYNEAGELRVGPMRLGPATCFGGDIPTVIDAFNVMNGLNLGNSQASREKLEIVASSLDMSLDDICTKTADLVIDKLEASIQDMFTLWEDEPAYKVWEVIHSRKFLLHRIIGIGAAAPAIVPMLAGRMKVEHFLHRYSPVANALGAALARPTLAVEVHIDTGREVYTGSPGGISGIINKRNYQMKDAQELARTCLTKLSGERGLAEYAEDARIYLEEQFNIIRGWDREGKLFDIGIQISPGFIHGFKGVKE
ncbi:MAG: hydantoinase/oxoprolinase family protein [Syntrophorhabdaceae bacterium]